MKESNRTNNRRYMKVFKESGCISANYNVSKPSDEVTVISYEGYEISGNVRSHGKKEE